MSNNQSSRNGALDFVKLIASIFIVLHHYQQYTGARFSVGPNFYGGQFGFSYMVELFFVISGYLVFKYIAVIQNDSSLTLWKWHLKHLARLLPLLICSVFVFQLGKLIYLSIPHTVRTPLLEHPVSLWETLMTCLAMHDGWAITTTYINASTWFISVLLICYIIFYIVTKAAQKLGCSPTYLYFGMILLGMSSLCSKNLPLLTPATSRGYYAFFFGVLLACFVNRFGICKKLKIIAAGTFVVTLSLLVISSPFVSANKGSVMTFMLFPSVIILCETAFAKKLFSNSIWNSLGAMTYSIYIWHVPVLLWIFIGLDLSGYNLDFSSRIIMAAFIVLMLVIGSISYHYIEKPIDKIIQPKLKNLLKKL